MVKSKNTEEKTCVFYSSDYHFEMITLPYIDKVIQENREVIILTENNLKETIRTLISKINLKKERKESILNIDWENNDLEKFKKLRKYTENNKEIVIFIKGTENYIKNINDNIGKWKDKSCNMKIIDCYNVEEISGKFVEITTEYKNILNTKGEKQINKI